MVEGILKTSDVERATKCQARCDNEARYKVKNPLTGLPDIFLCEAHLKEFEDIAVKLIQALNKSEEWVKAQEKLKYRRERPGGDGIRPQGRRDGVYSSHSEAAPPDPRQV